MKTKVNAKEFLMKHKWEILAAILLVAGTSAVTYRVTRKRDSIGAFLDALAMSYRDNQQMAYYTDEITKSWSQENRRLLADRGAILLKQIGDGLSKTEGAA